MILGAAYTSPPPCLWVRKTFAGMGKYVVSRLCVCMTANMDMILMSGRYKAGVA